MCVRGCVCDGFASWAQSSPVLPSWEMKGNILQAMLLYFHNLICVAHLRFSNWMEQFFSIKGKAF